MEPHRPFFCCHWSQPILCCPSEEPCSSHSPIAPFVLLSYYLVSCRFFFITALQQLILLKYKTTTPPGFQLHFLYRSLNMCIFSTLYPWNCDFFFEKWYNSMIRIFSGICCTQKGQTNKQTKAKNVTYTKSKKERPPIYINKFNQILAIGYVFVKTKERTVLNEHG